MDAQTKKNEKEVKSRIEYETTKEKLILHEQTFPKQPIIQMLSVNFTNSRDSTSNKEFPFILGILSAFLEAQKEVWEDSPV